MLDQNSQQGPTGLSEEGCLLPPSARLRTSVVIPARNEAELLPATLAGLANQWDDQGRPLPPDSFEVIVLANNCTDETASRARQIAHELEAKVTIHVVERTWPAELAHVGTARRWLMDQACRRLAAVGHPRGVIASTDADTVVAPNWIAATLDQINQGAEAVAGLIRIDARELRQIDPSIRKRYYGDLVYRRLKLELEASIDPNPLDPAPGHDFHGGASLAITPKTYQAIGGLPALPSREDVALTEACWLADVRFVHSAQVRVLTSARLLGRAQAGQSQELAGWTNQRPFLVRDADRIEAELLIRRRLRSIFRMHQDSRMQSDRLWLRKTFTVDENRINDLFLNQPTFGSWLHHLSTGSNAGLDHDHPLVPVEIAIKNLRSNIRLRCLQ